MKLRRALDDDDVNEGDRTDDVDPLLGTVLAGRYRVLRLIGRGGMGSVYAAEQAPLKREVALKVLRRDLVADPIAVERFKREAQIIAALAHPHVVALFDFGAAQSGELFIAMELLRGEDLYSRIKRRGALPWPRVLRIAEQTARALAGAHARGVIHRDLKPANVLLMNVDGVRDFVKVLDFGVAKLVLDKRDSNARALAAKNGGAGLTGDELVPGTIGFIAPEIIDGAVADDPRVDLYALGATCFQALTARAPFVGDSVVELLTRQMSDDVPRPSDVVDGIPAALDELVVRLLAKNPADRPASAADVVDELSRLESDLRPRAISLLASIGDDDHESDPAVPIAPATMTSVPRTPFSLAPRTTRVPIAFAVALFLVVAVGAFFVARNAMKPHDLHRDDVVYYPAPPPPSSSRPEHVVASTDAGTHAATVASKPRVHPATTEGTVMSSPIANVKPDPDEPQRRDPDEPDATSSIDDAWRTHADAVLSTCTESCAKVIEPRLATFDLAKLTRAVKDGVDECVAKCARDKRQ